jgi:hypothetical protein
MNEQKRISELEAEVSKLKEMISEVVSSSDAEWEYGKEFYDQMCAAVGQKSDETVLVK